MFTTYELFLMSVKKNKISEFPEIVFDACMCLRLGYKERTKEFKKIITQSSMSNLYLIKILIEDMQRIEYELTSKLKIILKIDTKTNLKINNCELNFEEAVCQKYKSIFIFINRWMRERGEFILQ